MNKEKALKILESITKNCYEDWIIPHHPEHCEEEITLPNGEKATIFMKDSVYDFLDYVKKLIEGDVNNG